MCKSLLGRIPHQKYRLTQTAFSSNSADLWQCLRESVFIQYIECTNKYTKRVNQS